MNTATKFVQIANKQAKVKGTYYGIPFSGVCKSSRQIASKPYPEELWIIFPNEINGQNGCLIWSNEVDAGIHFVEEDSGEE